MLGLMVTRKMGVVQGLYYITIEGTTYIHIYIFIYFIFVLAFMNKKNQMSWNKICLCNYVTLHSLPMGSLLELPYPLSDFGSRW